jgi:hypothetical protein
VSAVSTVRQRLSIEVCSKKALFTNQALIVPEKAENLRRIVSSLIVMLLSLGLSLFTFNVHAPEFFHGGHINESHTNRECKRSGEN